MSIIIQIGDGVTLEVENGIYDVVYQDVVVGETPFGVIRQRLSTSEVLAHGKRHANAIRDRIVGMLSHGDNEEFQEQLDCCQV